MSTHASRKQTLSMQNIGMSRPFDKKERSDPEGRQSNRNTRPSKTNRQPHHSSMSNDAQSIKGFGLCKYEKVTSKTSTSRERREASRDQETGGLMWFEDRIGDRPSRRDIADVKIKVEPTDDTSVKQSERNNYLKRKSVKKRFKHDKTKDLKALNNSRHIPETTLQRVCELEDDIRVKQEDTESESATQSLRGESRGDSQSESVQVKREIQEAHPQSELSEGEILEDDNTQIVQPPTNDISEANPNVVGPQHQAAVDLFRTTARDESIQRREKSVSPLVHAYQSDGAEIAEFAMDCGYAADNCSESDDTTGSVDYGTLPYFFGHECEIPETFQCYICSTIKPQSEFSKSQLSKYKRIMSINRRRNFKFSCFDCAPVNTYLKCSFCNKVKSIDSFSQSQRRERGPPRCIDCVISIGRQDGSDASLFTHPEAGMRYAQNKGAVPKRKNEEPDSDDGRSRGNRVPEKAVKKYKYDDDVDEVGNILDVL